MAGLHGAPPADASPPAAEGVEAPGEPYRWQLPPGFPEPWVPADNPMSAAKVALGRHLFYDRRLSVTGTFSCASCHRQELAFTDGRRQAVGATQDVHRRNTMSLANVAYGLSFNWADPSVDGLEEQLQTPLFGQHPVEMGLQPSPAVLDMLGADERLAPLFRAAFPDARNPVSFDHLSQAIASFERTLISGHSPFDRYWYQGDGQALSPSQQRGMALFFSRRLACSECHSRFNFSGPLRHRDARPRRPEMHNTGLYHLAAGAYPATDQGLIEQTGKPDDMGKFKPPTLRNIAVTGPYMHDGSIATLEAVIDHYARGGRTLTDGPNAGSGHLNPHKSEVVAGFDITATETADLIAFLHSLTDTEFLNDPRFAEPP